MERRSLWRIILEGIRRMEAEVNRMEEELFKMIKEAEVMRRCIMPLYNLYESGDEVILTADLPGTNKDEIELIAGEDYFKIEAPCKSPVRRIQEGRYVLHVQLPVRIVPETVKARYKEGVLEVVAKKKITGHRVKVE